MHIVDKRKSHFMWNLTSSDQGNITYGSNWTDFLTAMTTATEITVADFNGDGKSNVMVNYNPMSLVGCLNCPTGKIWTYTGCTDMELFYSMGYNTAAPQFQQYSLVNDVGPLAGAYEVTGDFNGDGRTDLAFYAVGDNSCGVVPHITVDQSGSSHYGIDDFFQFTFNALGQERLMQTITDGFNHVESFSYKPLTDPTVHGKGANSVFPLLSIQSPMYVLNTAQLPTDVLVGSTPHTTQLHISTIMRLLILAVWDFWVFKLFSASLMC